MQSILPNVSVMRQTEAYCTGKEGYAATKGNWNS